MAITPPDNTEAPLYPDLFGYIDANIRQNEDPFGILRAWVGDGKNVREGWTLQDAGGVWGLFNAWMEVLWWLRNGVLHDPTQCPPEHVDSIALERGLPQSLISAVRESAADDTAAELLVRKLAAAAPLIWRWKSTRAGGGEGGILRALQLLARYPVGIREVFAWRRSVSWTVAEGDRAAAQHMCTASPDPNRYDIYVIDWPEGIFTTADALAEMIRPDVPALQAVRLRRVRWFDDFLEADDATFYWTTDLQTDDTFKIVPPAPYRRPPGVDPYIPGGYAELINSSNAGTRYLRPITADAAVFSDVESHNHRVEATVKIVSTYVGTRDFVLDVNWDPATDAAYRVLIQEDGDVFLLADAAAPPTTTRATVAQAFTPQIMNQDALNVVVTVEPDKTGTPTSKEVQVLIDGELVLTYVDAALLHTTTGSVRARFQSVSSTLRLHHFSWMPHPAIPQLVTAGQPGVDPQ